MALNIRKTDDQIEKERVSRKEAEALIEELRHIVNGTQDGDMKFYRMKEIVQSEKAQAIANGGVLSGESSSSSRVPSVYSSNQGLPGMYSGGAIWLTDPKLLAALEEKKARKEAVTQALNQKHIDSMKRRKEEKENRRLEVARRKEEKKNARILRKEMLQREKTIKKKAKEVARKLAANYRKSLQGSDRSNKDTMKPMSRRKIRIRSLTFAAQLVLEVVENSMSLNAIQRNV